MTFLCSRATISIEVFVMQCEKLFEEIDKLNEQYISVWEDVCNIESPTDYKPGVDAAGQYFAKMAESRGWKVEVFEQSAAGDVVCITLNPEAKGQPITLSGHLDTVHPLGSFGTPAVKLDETKIYGPGVLDCKGGIVAAFFAMDALDKCGFTARPVRLILQTDEEVGSRLSNRATINYICDKAKDSLAFLNLEGGVKGKACLVRKGIVTFTFKITGVEAHSSACAKSGANAICEAAHKIIELEKIKDDEGLTCNCSIISGGTVVNTVPGYCEFKANVRYLTREQLEWIHNYVQQIADTVYVPGCTCEVDHPTGRIAMELVDRNVNLLNDLNRISVENGLEPLEANVHRGGSDAAEVTEAGIPCIDSLGPLGGNIHTPDEFGILDTLAVAAKRIAAYIYCI